VHEEGAAMSTTGRSKPDHGRLRGLAEAGDPNQSR
jgi:hypothetical protein